MTTRSFLSLLSLLACASGCGSGARVFNPGDGGGQPGLDLATGVLDGPPAKTCTELQNCYTVYAHSNHKLYHIDLANKSLVSVGPFNAPKVNGSEDTITDLAVAPDNTIYVVSKTNLYTADPNDGHVTLLGMITTCGQDNVALTFTPDGSLYVADFKGAFCKIDPSSRPPKVTAIGMIGGGLAIEGDIVAVKDGTMFGTAYKTSDPANGPTHLSNILVTIDPATGQVKTMIGPTGYPKLFGVAFEMGLVFGFTHDGSGNVITIDPKTGKGTLYGTFKDPTTNMGISFSGAGVNAMVEAPPPG